MVTKEFDPITGGVACMIRVTYIGGWLIALALVTAACGPRSEAPLATVVETIDSPTGTRPALAPRIVPPAVENATPLMAAPASPPDAASVSTTGGEVTLLQDPIGVVEGPDGDAVSGPTAEQAALLASLPDGGEAPELENEVWLNSPPLRIAELRGKVVLLDMWTFG